jgi:hypothetical protein
MNIPPMIEVLENAGFTDGWALHGETLILWEHDQDPPAPLTRPEATDETHSTD